MASEEGEEDPRQSARSLLADLRVQPCEPSQPGLYRTDLHEGWNFLSPSGGVLTSVALSAMRAELGDPSWALRSSTTVFSKQVFAGPLLVRVEVLRQGRLATQVRAELTPQDQVGPGEGLSVLAVFSKTQPGPSLTGARFPDVPGPEAGRVQPWAKRKVRFFQNLEDRMVLGHLSWERDWEAGPARYARWLRYLRPSVDALGQPDPLVLPPIADLMPPALIRALGPDAPRFWAPSLDLTMHYFQPSPGPWFLVFGRASWAGEGICSAQVEIWDEAKRLLAFGTQTMLIRARKAARPASESQ